MAALTAGTIKTRIYDLFRMLEPEEQAKCCEGISVLQGMSEREAKAKRKAAVETGGQTQLRIAPPDDRPVVDAEYVDQEDKE